MLLQHVKEFIYELDENNNYNGKAICPICGKENIKFDESCVYCEHLKLIRKRDNRIFAIFVDMNSIISS